MENKTSKYFKYAIGEIVLVVIGILIALQINNWNQNRKNDLIETNYIKNIKRDLNDQLESIAIQSKYELSFINAASYILEDFKNNSQLKFDTAFYKNLTKLQGRKTFVITDPTFTDLLSSGNINLIKKVLFKDKLIQYYQELERIEKVIQNNNSLITDQQFGPMLSKLGYYYADLTKDETNYAAKENSIELSAFYNTELAKASEALILKAENKLLLMNTVNLRHTISLGHLKMMNQLKTNTEHILEELNKITKD